MWPPSAASSFCPISGAKTQEIAPARSAARELLRSALLRLCGRAFQPRQPAPGASGSRLLKQLYAAYGQLQPVDPDGGVLGEEAELPVALTQLLDQPQHTVRTDG